MRRPGLVIQVRPCGFEHAEPCIVSFFDGRNPVAGFQKPGPTTTRTLTSGEHQHVCANVKTERPVVPPSLPACHLQVPLLSTALKYGNTLDAYMHPQVALLVANPATAMFPFWILFPSGFYMLQGSRMQLELFIPVLLGSETGRCWGLSTGTCIVVQAMIQVPSMSFPHFGNSNLGQLPLPRWSLL